MDAQDRGGLRYRPGANSHILDSVTEPFPDKAYPDVSRMVTHYEETWDQVAVNGVGTSKMKRDQDLALEATESASADTGDV